MLVKLCDIYGVGCVRTEQRLSRDGDGKGEEERYYLGYYIHGYSSVDICLMKLVRSGSADCGKIPVAQSTQAGWISAFLPHLLLSSFFHSF